MADILAFEADRRTINITVNSLGTQLTKEQRASLFPTIGRLYPAGNSILARAEDLDQIRGVVEQVPEYKDFFTSPAGRSGGLGFDEEGDSPIAAAESLEDHFFRVSIFTVALFKLCRVASHKTTNGQMEVHLNKLAFLQQFQYAVFYAYFKLKEQVRHVHQCLLASII